MSLSETVLQIYLQFTRKGKHDKKTVSSSLVKGIVDDEHLFSVLASERIKKISDDRNAHLLLSIAYSVNPL